MPADLNISQLTVHEGSVHPGDQVNVSWTISNRGDSDTTGSEHILFEVQDPDHAPARKDEIPMSTKIPAGHEQHYNHAVNAPDRPGDYEVFVFPDPPHGGSARGAFTVAAEN